MKGEKETSRQDLVKQLHFLDIPLEETYNFNGSFRNFAFTKRKERIIWQKSHLIMTSAHSPGIRQR
jgi:hypothetical protein